jgi:hypothetical protein
MIYQENKSRKQNFLMRAALMWTINDFLAYGMISSWSTHGKLSCPYYMENNKAFTVTNRGKAFFLLPLSFLANESQIHKEHKGFLYWQS